MLFIQFNLMFLSCFKQIVVRINSVYGTLFAPQNGCYFYREK